MVSYPNKGFYDQEIASKDNIDFHNTPDSSAHRFQTSALID